MWASIFWFEVRYQLRQPLFYLIAFFLAVLLFVAGTGHGPGVAAGRLQLNAPAVILELLVQGVHLVLFLTTAFVASAALRDFDRGTAELFFSKPISRFDYLTGRYAGTMLVCTLACLIGVIALAAGTSMPWVDPARIGPFRWAPYAFALGVLILPTLLALGALFFAVASWTRSALGTYVGVVAFFSASVSAGFAASHLDAQWIGQLLDPFGVTALSDALRHWTLEELNTRVPELGGALLWNRILWLVLGVAALGSVVRGFDPSHRPRRKERASPASQAPAPVAPIRAPSTATRRAFSRRSVLIQFLHQVRREWITVVGTLPFLGILVLALFVLLQAAASAGDLFGMPVHPRTSLMLGAMQEGYTVILLLVVVLYSGELIWKHRAIELDEIVDSMPTPNGVYLGATLCALLGVIALFLLVGALALIGYQLSQGHREIELGLYLRGIAVVSVYPALMMVLSCFLHIVARGRIAGYGLVILFIISWDFLEEFGFEHHLYRFASLPPMPWSDLSGYGPFLAPFAWYSLYWGFGALILVGLSILLWRRGRDAAWVARWTEARARIRGSARVLMAAGAIGAAAAGSWIFYNTNVLNAYMSSGDAAQRRAAYERLYRAYQALDLPRIVAVRAEVDLFPEHRRVELRVRYRLRNRSNRPMRDLHVSMPDRVRVNRLELPEHEVVLRDESLGYSIHRLRDAIAPGDSIEAGFELTMVNEGFVNHGTPVAVLGNGSYFTTRDAFPVIGYDAHRQLADADERRRYGLEPDSGLVGSDDPDARWSTPRASDADYIDFEATVSTRSDQIAITSGERLREWVEGDRRYAHYRAEHPITHYVAFVSARYRVARREFVPATGAAPVVAVEVYHHPAHGDNVARMLDAATKALAYFSAQFGPYQERHLRVVEVPGHARDATSFPGMITFSESLGFNARLGGDEAIDYPFYVTAHEVAHQWWGQQLVGANVPGVAMLHETLAQYSALMVMQGELGVNGIRRVLAREHDQFLRGRAGERGVEPPLARVERQDYVHYHKGALAMFALRDAVGEQRLNQVLSRFLARASAAQPPYSTTADLLDAFRTELPEASLPLIEDLFERITTYDIGIVDATAAPGPDGNFRLRVALRARKLRGDGSGAERELRVDDWIDIAVYRDATHGEREAAELLLERRRLRPEDLVFEFVIDRAPVRIEVDPYFKLIDRERGDNVRSVSMEDASP